jgi:dynactin complex subunit
VGDGVRIESLGFEGMLRFVGEIDGKEGLFAGIELSGGFTGKGKNDGSVAGCVNNENLFCYILF